MVELKGVSHSYGQQPVLKGIDSLSYGKARSSS